MGPREKKIPKTTLKRPYHSQNTALSPETLPERAGGLAIRAPMVDSPPKFKTAPRSLE